MPVKLIGRKTDFCGKTLWEIVGNLKNFGVGRLVKRNMFERYPEPSFFRIAKVHTEKNEEVRKVTVWAEKIFRGRQYPQLIELYSASYKADYRLIPKAEEQSLWDRVKQTKLEDRVIPETVPFPPLLRQFIMKEMEASNQAVTEPRLKLVIRSGRDNHYEQSDNSKPPTVKIEPTHVRKISL